MMEGASFRDAAGSENTALSPSPAMPGDGENGAETRRCFDRAVTVRVRCFSPSQSPNGYGVRRSFLVSTAILDWMLHRNHVQTISGDAHRLRIGATHRPPMLDCSSI